MWASTSTRWPVLADVRLDDPTQGVYDEFMGGLSYYIICHRACPPDDRLLCLAPGGRYPTSTPTFHGGRPRLVRAPLTHPCPGHSQTPTNTSPRYVDQSIIQSMHMHESLDIASDNLSFLDLNIGARSSEDEFLLRDKSQARRR